MTETNSQFPAAGPADEVATQWFIRRQRGLSVAEQYDYEKWVGQDPRHAAAIVQLEKVWTMMDPVFAGGVPDGVQPRDLLAPRARGHLRVWVPIVIGAAAAALLVFLRPAT